MSEVQSAFERGILRMFMRDTTYQQKYPHTTKYNVFSVSSLSGHHKWAFKNKTNPDYSKNIFMIVGTALHQYLQEKFGKEMESFNEKELRVVIPFAWKNLKREDGTPEDTIVITGHMDNIDMANHVIIELKTSFTPFTDWPKYFLQAGFYGAWAEKEYGVVFSTKVIHLSRKAEVRVLTPEDKYHAWVMMQYKAIYLARKLDAWLGATTKA